jgi:hypothetical protein
MLILVAVGFVFTYWYIALPVIAAATVVTGCIRCRRQKLAPSGPGRATPGG